MFSLVKIEMEDDSDIYSDLPLYNFDEEIEKLKAGNNSLTSEVIHLQEELDKVTKERDEYQSKCTTLTKNISSLLKTAQAEIQRKDKLIKELRSQRSETQSYRKREPPKDLEDGEVPASKRSTNGFIEHQKSTLQESFSSVPTISKQNGLTSSEDKSVSVYNKNTVNNSKQDASNIGLLRQNPKRLPFANVHCKTVYSQRMFNKMQELSTVNGSSDLSKPKNDKGNHNNDNITDRNELCKSATGDSAKENREQKGVTSCKKGDAASVSILPGIDKLTNSVVNTDKTQKETNLRQANIESVTSIENNQLEALFGSPLKWTESCNETIPQLASTSPAVYDDSCSALIENVKFSLNVHKPTLPKPVSTTKSTTPKITPINRSASIIQRQVLKQPQVSEKNRSDCNENKWVRAFENVSNVSMQKPKSVFPNLRKDAGKFSSISVNISKESSVDVPAHNFLFKSKYEDSVLGQFDDTTQFVSALTKVESKISPLNTPVKCSSQILSVNMCTTSVSSPASKQETDVHQTTNKLEVKQEANSTSRLVNKEPAITEKPINILQPRKTPRIVNYNKSKGIDVKSSAAPIPTPTKINRFAINEEFISKQEEKVLKESFSNVNDPIAISISSKCKTKSKDCHSPKGKTSRSSPKGKQSNVLKVKKPKLTDSPLERIHSIDRADETEINSSEKMLDYNPNLLRNTSEHSATLNQVVSNDPPIEIVERSLPKSRLTTPENPSNLIGSSENHLCKQYQDTQENLAVQASVEKHQSKLHKSTSDNPSNLPNSLEKERPKLQNHLENPSNLRKSPSQSKLQASNEKKSSIVRGSYEKYLPSSYQTNLEKSSSISRNHEKQHPSSRSREKLQPKSHSKQENLRKSSEKLHSPTHQSNQEIPNNIPRNLEKLSQSYQSCLERPSSLNIYDKQQSRSHQSSIENLPNLPKIQENWQQSRSRLVTQEKPTKEQLNAEECSSYLQEHFPNGATLNSFHKAIDKQSKRKTIDNLASSPQLNVIKFNKRCEEKLQIRTDDAKSNLFQDSKNKKMIVLANTLEKKTSRIQNFKPSSQLRKQADTSFLSKEKCNQNRVKKEINDNHKSPNNSISYSKNVSSIESPAMEIEKFSTSDGPCKDISRNVDKLPMIVRSSKKPEFVSTTLSDDDYASKTPTKSAEYFKSRNSEVIELMEWVLKPITFDCDDQSVEKRLTVSNQRTVLICKEMQPSSDSSEQKGKSPTAHCDDELEMQNNKTDSFVLPTCPSQIKVVNSAPSPNKIIRGRRPLNFGVSVVTH